MKQIDISQGKIAIIDDKDFERVSQFNWCADKGNNGKYYAVSKDSEGRKLYMHRLVLGLKIGDGKHSDHINNNGLDNRISNLRECTNQQNSCNRAKANSNTSGYKGVSWFRTINKWRARIVVNGKEIYLGSFDDILDAAKAYNKATLKYNGEFAHLNIIND